ncbi:MAG: ABC transporter ATP-binding protein [Lentisphaeria bacterium]|nr:ABC transporter ATP-binding protein [Lentisphaeria bacterium]
MSLSLIHANYSYRKGAAAVKDLSYAFKQGKFYGIFGANGSGKSTLLKMLAGDVEPDNPVLLEDKALKAYSSMELAKLLAYAVQDAELILPFKVRDCITLGRYVWRDSDCGLIDRLLKDWNVEHLQDKQFSELSGGERQKIKLLRILAQATKYILLDEPASSLDLPKQIELYEKLQNIAHNENKCVIMVCHDLYIAPSYIDEMLIMKKGNLLYAGKVDTAEAEKAAAEAFERKFRISRKFQSVEINW